MNVVMYMYCCRVPARLESLHNTAIEKWHFAYHGMCPSHVRKLLDAGDLLAVCSKLKESNATEYSLVLRVTLSLYSLM